MSFVQWDQDDNEALMALLPDLVLFVGDFGNENAPLVRTVSQACSGDVLSSAI